MPRTKVTATRTDRADRPVLPLGHKTKKVKPEDGMPGMKFVRHSKKQQRLNKSRQPKSGLEEDETPEERYRREMRTEIKTASIERLKRLAGCPRIETEDTIQGIDPKSGNKIRVKRACAADDLRCFIMAMMNRICHDVIVYTEYRNTKTAQLSALRNSLKNMRGLRLFM